MNDQNHQVQEQVKEIQRYEIQQYKPSTCIQHVSYLLVRPPRLIYNQILLKPKNASGRSYRHTVYHIPFPLSLYEPDNMEYVILYLHGNASSRLEGVQQLSLLPKYVGLACFDFDDCGNRWQKEYISLGKGEALQVDIAFEFLKGRGHRVVGWGRSMGSVSLLLSSQCKILVVDSPFSSLKKLCYQHSSKYIPLLCMPAFFCLFPCVMCCVDCDIQKKADIRFDEMEICDRINQNKNRSILFLAGREDSLISYQHAQKLFQRFEGRKKIAIFQGDHHSDRPMEALLTAYVWIDEEFERMEGDLGNSGKIMSSPLSAKEQAHGKSLSQTALLNQYQCLQTASNSQSLTVEQIQEEKATHECEQNGVLQSKQQLDQDAS